MVGDRGGLAGALPGRERAGAGRTELEDDGGKRGRLRANWSPNDQNSSLFFQNFLLQFSKVLNLYTLKFQLV